MTTVTICQFYFEGKVVGKAPIPELSTTQVRRDIAKFLGIKQYDEVKFYDYQIENTLVARRFPVPDEEKTLIE